MDTHQSERYDLDLLQDPHQRDKLDPDPQAQHQQQSDKLDRDPHIFEDKAKCMKNELI
jgi:hypothetical protein